MENNFSISKNICIGLFISGSMAYFDDEDRAKEAAIQDIEESLRKKLEPFRNGTDSFRQKAKKSLSKKKKNKKDLEIMEKIKLYNNRFITHSSIANKAWVRLQDSIKDKKFAINSFIVTLLYRNPEAKKYYNFSNKAIRELSAYRYDIPISKQIELKMHNYTFSSLQISNKLLNLLEDEIEKYNSEFVSDTNCIKKSRDG